PPRRTGGLGEALPSRPRRGPHCDETSMMLAACALLCSGAVVMDRTTGGLQSILNTLTGRKLELQDEPFRVTTTAGEYASRDCVVQDNGGAAFRYTCGQLKVDLRY